MLDKQIGKYYAEYRKKFGNCIGRQSIGKFKYCIASCPDNPINCPYVNSEKIGINRLDGKGKKYMQWYSGCSYDDYDKDE